MKHELKIWPQYYCRVADGSKTFEVRKNDRGFQPGDTVVLREWDASLLERNREAYERAFRAGYSGAVLEPSGFTDSAKLEFKIGYVLPLDADRVVFSLLPIEVPDENT